MRQLMFPAVAALSLLVVEQAGAAIIPIANPSFESPSTAMWTNGVVDGWTILGNTFLGGVQHSGWGPPILDGVQEGWLQPGATFQQNVGAYDPATSYLLGYLAGATNSDIQYSVSLLVIGANPGTLASYTGSVLQNQWDSQQTLIAPANPSLSGDLYIQLSAVSGTETEFDRISLQTVPEPISIVIWSLIVGAAGLGLVWRKRRAA
jgi:hypothetical protein